MNNRNNLRRAMDATLPGLEQDVWFEQRVLNRLREPRTARRGISKRTVLVLLLAAMLLLSATAVAAVLLSGREVVDEYAVPMAGDTAGDSYTVAQTLELVALAEENGILLSDNAKESIDKMLAAGEGYYKEELIMAIAKAEFGAQPAAWTLEQQNWFDDVCVAIGFIPQKEKAMPEKGEDAFAWAAAIAARHIREYYGETADLQDANVYEPVGVQYINGDVDGEYPGMYYAVTYMPLSGTEAALHAREYWVYLNDDGEILGQVQRYFSDSAYRNTYGDHFESWPQYALRSYQEVLMSQTPTPGNMKTIICMRMTSYPDIAGDAISREAARQIAAEYFGVAADACLDSVYIGDAPNPVWKIILGFNDESGEWVNYTAEVDSITGAVKRSEQLPMYGMHWRPLFLERVKEEAEIEYQQYLETIPGNG